MSNYRKKFAPTKDGFQEVLDSMQDPTIEQLMAGIQMKRPTKKQLLEKIKYFRESRSTLDIELYHLSDYAKDYNDKYAAKNLYDFGVTEGLQNRTKSQCKRWSDMLELTSPRFKQSAVPPGADQSVYKASYLTHKPYELDLWGPASYGTLIYDLKTELDFIINHMDDGEHMCKDVIAREEEINKDPELKKQLFEKQYREEEERNSDTILDYCNEGRINTDNPVYQKMLRYDCRDDFVNDNLHKYPTHQFARYVIIDSTQNALQRNITPIEKRLLGDDFDKIIKVRYAIANLDLLLDVKASGQFEPLSIVQCIRWCNVLPSTRKHRDNEHIFYDKYLKPNYKGYHTWPAWNTVFTHRKTIGDDEHLYKMDVAAFEKKFKEVCSSISEE